MKLDFKIQAQKYLGQPGSLQYQAQLYDFQHGIKGFFFRRIVNKERFNHTRECQEEEEGCGASGSLNPPSVSFLASLRRLAKNGRWGNESCRSQAGFKALFRSRIGPRRWRVKPSALRSGARPRCLVPLLAQAGERQVLFPQMVLPVIEYKTLFTARKPIGANHLVVLFRSAHLKGDRGLASSPGSRNWLAVASFSRLFMRLLPIPHSDPLSIMEIVTSGRVFEGRSIRRVNTLG
ncbi:hypothetical protein CIHG_01300 [Coccidioides immitis H538.4]|uniref:Uncharacterized protein n=1 Tax=Coccidioides immitis H538.4 TaxID=396776 RepID=A0A0J8U8V7_COCIT|nr:hypothetical protein CIHG_01300 [Coccidioides immitis H538.4]